MSQSLFHFPQSVLILESWLVILISKTIDKAVQAHTMPSLPRMTKKSGQVKQNTPFSPFFSI